MGNAFLESDSRAIQTDLSEMCVQDQDASVSGRRFLVAGNSEHCEKDKGLALRNPHVLELAKIFHSHQ